MSSLVSTSSLASNPSGARRFSLALLSNGVSPHNDNHNRIVAALSDAGWEVTVIAHQDISLIGGIVFANGAALDQFDLVWMLGLGERHDFMDRCQILANLPPGKLLNSAQGMLLMHSKHMSLPHSPLSCSGNNVAALLEVARQHPEIERWVVKPAAGSYGRNVWRVRGLAELQKALEQATTGPNYCLMQAYVEEISGGETRSLVVNGEIIGSYLRVPEHDFLANLSSGARARTAMLSEQQKGQVLDVSAALHKRGIRFAAVDMAFPYLIEVNVANPGGFATLASLEGTEQPDVGGRLAEALGSMLAQSATLAD